MTETKLAESTYSKFKLSNSYYDIYTSNSTSEVIKKQESSMGTLIAISKFLRPYIHNIKTMPGIAIAIDFFFLQNQKTRVISVYLPSNNKKLNQNTQQEIVTWITYSHTHNYNTIVLGDFNYDRRKHKTQPAIQLFTAMQTHGMNSLLKYFNINSPTWARGPLQSQIDDIWISSALLPNITQSELISAELITNSDHKIISTT
jgi:exonuclease III